MKCPTKLLVSHPLDRKISADKLIFSSAQALGVGLEAAIPAPTSPLQIDYIKRGLSLNRLTEYFLYSGSNKRSALVRLYVGAKPHKVV